MISDAYPARWTGRQAIVPLPEYIGLSNAGLIREELLSVINRGATTLIADMTATISCDHAGADAVARAFQRAVISGTDLRLVVTARIVRRVLAINATRCCWPPDSCQGRSRRRFSSPTRAAISRTAERRGRRLARRSGRAMFCATVSDGSRLKAWTTNPIRSRRRIVNRRSLRCARSVRPRATLPEVGRSSPAATFRSVLLPEPDGPMIVVNDPGDSAALTPLRATTVPAPRPWTLRTSRRATEGAGTEAPVVMTAWFNMSRTYGPGHRIHIVAKLDSGSSRPTIGVEQTGRAALAEMREDGEGVELGPQPGFDRLDALLQDVGRAGLPVRLQIDGDRLDLPRGMDISAYRIVQEGLTNALKHAHATRAEVALEYAPDQLRIEVSDNGHGAARSDNRGHGLFGIHERVKLYGGEMTTATTNGGGFSLTACLPPARYRS